MISLYMWTLGVLTRYTKNITEFFIDNLHKADLIILRAVLKACSVQVPGELNYGEWECVFVTEVMFGDGAGVCIGC